MRTFGHCRPIRDGNGEAVGVKPSPPRAITVKQLLEKARAKKAAKAQRLEKQKQARAEKNYLIAWIWNGDFMSIIKSILGYQELRCSNCGDPFNVGPLFDTDEWNGLCEFCQEDKLDNEQKAKDDAQYVEVFFPRTWGTIAVWEWFDRSHFEYWMNTDLQCWEAWI